MKIYTDIFTGDQVLTDSHHIIDAFDGIVYQVPGKYINKSSQDFDTSHDEDKQNNVGMVRVVDVIEANQLQPHALSKQNFAQWSKTYLSKVRDYLTINNPDRVEPFMRHSTTFIRHILVDYNSYDLYMGPSMNPNNGGLVFVTFTDQFNCTLYFLKDGLKEEQL